MGRSIKYGNIITFHKTKRALKKAKLASMITLASVLALSLMQNVFGAQLNLNLTTDKTTYGPGMLVTVTGTLTMNNNPVSGGLISIQVNDPTGEVGKSIIRTIATGNNITNTWPIQILGVIPIGNIYGTPSYSFTRGSYVGLNVTIANNYSSSRALMIVVTIFDSNTAPIGTALMYNGTIEASETKNLVSYPMIQIPTGAPTGIGKICVSVLNSKYPDNGGFPLAPEATTTFSVISGSLSIASNSATSVTSLASTAGTGNMTFRLLSLNVKLGNYTVYAVAVYYSGSFPYLAYDSSQFSVVLLGDLNHDGKVDIRDIAIVAKAYGSTIGPPPSPNWNPVADLTGDGKVDIRDIAIVAKNYGMSGSL